MAPSNHAATVALVVLSFAAQQGGASAASRGAGSQEESVSTTLPQALYVSTGLNPWPTNADGITKIRVCFAQSAKKACDTIGGCNFSARQELVKNALLRTWDVYTNLSFWDFGMCDAGGGSDNPPDALVIQPPKDLGCQFGFGNTAGYRSNGGYNSIFELSFGSDLCDDAQDDGRWAGIVVHEAGHALGFEHEHERPENFDSSGRAIRCLDGAFLNPNATKKTYYDNWSIMQYCSNNLTGWDGAPDGFGDTIFLSFGDIEGAQKVYGVSKTARALQAVAAINHLN